MQDNSKTKVNMSERSIDIMRLLRVLWKRALVIILVAVVSGVVTLTCAKLFVTPTYRSSFTAYVNNRLATSENQSNMTSADIVASRNLTYLYQEIILSRSVLMDAASDCGLEMSYHDLTRNVTTSVSANAAIISVDVTAKSPAEAEQLASAIAAIAPEHVARVVDGSSMRILDTPLTPQSPYAPNILRCAVVGFVIALAVSCAVVIVFDVIVDKVAAPEEMEDRYGVAVVGIIPDMQQAERYQYSATAETHRRK